MTEARMSPNWAIRMIVAGIAFVGFGCWSLYDGKVKYPNIESTFQEFDAAGKMEEWIAYAGQKGWKKEPHIDKETGGRYIYSAWDIRTQFMMAGICLPIGLIILGRLFLTAPRRLSADDEALTSTRGVRIPYEAIRDINKDRWDRKGIAVVAYEINGKSGKAVIDDWIFKGAAAVLKKVEFTLHPELAAAEEAAAAEALAAEAEEWEEEEGEWEEDPDGEETESEDEEKPAE